METGAQSSPFPDTGAPLTALGPLLPRKEDPVSSGLVSQFLSSRATSSELPVPDADQVVPFRVPKRFPSPVLWLLVT